MKELLILRASEDIQQTEVDNIKSQAELYGLTVVVKDVLTEEALEAALYCNETYDYIYLATHGCEDSWGNLSGSLGVSWIQFAADVCQSGISKPGAIFLHSCCKGGLEKVAYDMFACCPKIQLVCGPRFDVRPCDLVMGFNLFVYNIVVRGVDPIVAADKVLSAIDLRLRCFDRLDCEHTYDYKQYCAEIQPQIDKAFGFTIIEHS